ncbi:MAG: ORC1-type DNA replication protein [archaeon]
MTQKTIQDLFSDYLNKKPIFTNKKVLTISYTPEDVPHRDDQINQLGLILAPALKNDRPSNIFIYGGTGTGKTLITQYVTNQLSLAAEKAGSDLHIMYVNCKMKRVADTEYRLLAYLATMLGKEVPPTGLPTDQVYKIFFEALEQRKGIIILIIDEIDALISKVGDELLYNLTRINQELINTKISIIGISNNLSFTDYMDARVKSALSEEELVFPPYNAVQLQDILNDRAKISFNPDKIKEGVIAKCAALAAQEHGDARRALDLLRVAGELTERNNDTQITEKHVDLAESKVDMDRIMEVVKTQPKQSKAVMCSIFTHLDGTSKEKILTGEVYDTYINICTQISLKPLTQRRISDIITELDMLSIINAKVISKGRYGRTREIGVAISQDIHSRVMDYLKKEFYL